MASTPSPDDICAVCETARDQHGDMQHEFSEDGQLIKKQPPQPARQSPPSTSDISKQLADQMSTQLVLRLVERMVARDMLTAEDMLYIFGGKE